MRILHAAISLAERWLYLCVWSWGGCASLLGTRDTYVLLVPVLLLLLLLQVAGRYYWRRHLRASC